MTTEMPRCLSKRKKFSTIFKFDIVTLPPLKAYKARKMAKEKWVETVVKHNSNVREMAHSPRQGLLLSKVVSFRTNIPAFQYSNIPAFQHSNTPHSMFSR